VVDIDLNRGSFKTFLNLHAYDFSQLNPDNILDLPDFSSRESSSGFGLPVGAFVILTVDYLSLGA